MNEVALEGLQDAVGAPRQVVLPSEVSNNSAEDLLFAELAHVFSHRPGGPEWSPADPDTAAQRGEAVQVDISLTPG